MSKCILIILTFVFGSGNLAQAQPEGERSGGREDRGGERRERRDGERREGRRERRRQGGREDWDRYRNATPQEREKMRTDRMLDMTARNYDLSEEQKVVVRAEMEKMREERKMLMGADYDRYEQLREKQFEFGRRGGPDRGGREGRGGPPDWDRMRNDPEFQKLRNEMRELETKYPFDWQASIKRVETLLPPEQAAKGRARFEERRSRFDERRQRMELELQQEIMKTTGEIQEAMASGDQKRVAELLEQASKRLDDAWLPDDAKLKMRQSIEAARQQAGLDNPAAKVEVAAEHPWEKQVREFVTKYQLSAAQQSAAAGILKDVRDRASQIEIANAPKVAAAKELGDAKEREDKLKALNAPIVKLQEELTIRLDGMLTAEQRKKAGK